MRASNARVSLTVMTKAAHRIEVSLPDDLAKIVERKVESGAYASASEVLHDGLRALVDRDVAIERWLRDEVLPGHEEYRRDPGTGIAAEDVLKRIQQKRLSRKLT